MKLFSSGKGTFECRILLLDNTEQRHTLTNKSLGDELLMKVFVALDLYEREYFGLKFRDRNGQSHWLDPTKVVKKQIMTNFNTPVYTFYFSVKFYAADPTKLREEITRYQFFLQIKKDILQGRIVCDLKTSSELSAYSVQSELGDYEPSIHIGNFISQFRFIPNQTKEFEDMVFDTYRKLRGLTPADIEIKFLERVKWLEMYGIDLHSVKGQDSMEYLLGLSPTGIVLFRNKSKIGSFIWPKITKLKYKGHCFLLRATQGRNDEEKEYTFLCADKDSAKDLWKCCAEHHTFFRLEKVNDVPASAHNFLFKKGSKFRFSGRTQQQLEKEVDTRPRIQPSVYRTPSLKRDQTDQAPLYSKNGSNFDLYSSGQKNSYPARPLSVGIEKRITPKYQGSGYSSAGEVEQKRRRNHYYSGYTSTGEPEVVQNNNSRYGSAPNVQYKVTDISQRNHSTPEYTPNIVQQTSRDQQHTPHDFEQQRIYPTGSKSDGEENSRNRRRHRYHRPGDAGTDSEMVAPLDIYQNHSDVQNRRPQQRHQNERRSHRHHRHTYDPTQAEVLLELGPNESESVEKQHAINYVSRSGSSLRNSSPSVYQQNSPHPLHQYLPQHLRGRNLQALTSRNRMSMDQQRSNEFSNYLVSTEL